MKERILQFIAYKGMNNHAFEQMCGMSNGYINSMRKGLGAPKIEQVLSLFPELSREWLMTGEGEMIKKYDAAPESNVVHEKGGEYESLKRKLEDANNIIEQQKRLIDQQARMIDILQGGADASQKVG